MPGVFVFLVLAAIFILIPLAIAQSKRTSEAWAEAARRLGLTFSRGGVLTGRTIEGQFGELFVKVDTYTRSSGSGNSRSSTTYTRFVVLFHAPLGLGLRLSREGFFTGVTKFFGAQDIEVGDAGFDSDILVKGRDQARVREFLTQARRVRIRRLFTNFRGATIDDAGVRYSQLGFIRDASRLEAIVQALARVAWFLCGDRSEDDSFERSLRARDEGRPEEALEILRAGRTRSKRRGRSGRGVGVVVPPPLPTRQRAGKLKSELKPPKVETQELPRVSEPAPQEVEIDLVDEAFLESELLHLGGRDNEAKAILDDAIELAPLDDELRELSEEIAPEPSAPAVVDDGRGARDEVASSPELDLDAPAACRELFDRTRNSIETSRIFDERFVGKRVTWTGKLESSETFPFDFVFGSEEGAKAIVEVFDSGESLYGGGQVFAIVKISRDQAEALASAEGRRVRLSGTLLKIDGFMRNLYLTDGSVVFEHG